MGGGISLFFDFEEKLKELFFFSSPPLDGPIICNDLPKAQYGNVNNNYNNIYEVPIICQALFLSVLYVLIHLNLPTNVDKVGIIIFTLQVRKWTYSETI